MSQNNFNNSTFIKFVNINLLNNISNNNCFKYVIKIKIYFNLLINFLLKKLKPFKLQFIPK